MKRFHEAPLCIFDEVQANTDGDYFLVHLFEENKTYWEKAVESVAKGRHTILDNSIFELGESFDSERFLYWVNKLKPTEYIIPDVLEDAVATFERIQRWNIDFKPRVEYDGKTIGVVQGRNYDEVAWCYSMIEPRVDKIAISFDYSFLCPEPDYTPETRCEVFMRGRQRLLERLVKNRIINTSKPHHALGCFLPQEFKAYKDYRWLDSLDTSSPVIAGINCVEYNDEGLRVKDPTKVIEYMNSNLLPCQRRIIMENIEKFKEFV